MGHSFQKETCYYFDTTPVAVTLICVDLSSREIFAVVAIDFYVLQDYHSKQNSSRKTSSRNSLKHIYHYVDNFDLETILSEKNVYCFINNEKRFEDSLNVIVQHSVGNE